MYVVVVVIVDEDDLVVIVVDIMLPLLLFLLPLPPVQYNRQSVKTEKMSSPNVVCTSRCRDIFVIWWLEELVVFFFAE